MSNPDAVTTPGGVPVVFAWSCEECGNEWTKGDRIRPEWVGIGAVGECPSCGAWAKACARVVVDLSG